jgi:hypothetical protein
LGAGNETDVTVSNFFQAGNENEVTVAIFKLVGNGNDLTITSGRNDAHLWVKPCVWPPELPTLLLPSTRVKSSVKDSIPYQDLQNCFLLVVPLTTVIDWFFFLCSSVVSISVPVPIVLLLVFLAIRFLSF